MEKTPRGPVNSGANPFNYNRPHNNPGTQYSYPTPPRHAVSEPRTWVYKEPSKWKLTTEYIRSHSLIIVMSLIVASVLVAAYLVVSSLSSGSGNTVQLVNQPPTAAQIAAQLKCGKFKDTGPAQAGGAVDTGFCFIGKQKYAIDTFANQDARDSWLEMATKLGVNPKWQTATSVTYPSITK